MTGLQRTTPAELERLAAEHRAEIEIDNAQGLAFVKVGRTLHYAVVEGRAS